MAKASISFVKGKGSMNHNNRVFIHDNVDRDRIKDNITYKSETLEEAYEKCFGKAIEDYNASQNRKDRHIDGAKGYMEKIKHSGNGEKLFYENVVQIGNMHDCHVGTAKGELCKVILDEYMREFEQKNPNLYVFNAVLHMDEQTPHLHIDYIPLAKQYKKGLSVRNSLDKALKEQGIGGKTDKFANSTMAWQNREKNTVEEVMKRHGLERMAEKGLHEEHKTVDYYKKVAREVENQVRTMPKQIETGPYAFNKERVSVTVKDLEVLEKRAKLSAVHKKATEKLEKEVQSIKDTFESDKNAIISSYEKKLRDEMSVSAELERKNRDLRSGNTQLNTAYHNLQQRFMDQAGEVERLRTENATLKAENRTLRDALSGLNKRINEIVLSNLALSKAVSWLKERITDSSLLKVCQAVEEYAAHWLKEDGFPEMAEEVGKAELSKGIRNYLDKEKEVKIEYPEKLIFKGGMKGQGFYDKNGQFWGDKSKLKEFKELGITITDPYELLKKNRS